LSNFTQTDPTFEALLDYLNKSRGFDFTGYKRSSLMRRVQKRMESVGTHTFGSYIDYLEVHPHEFNALFNTILINVTSFFRDEEAWKFLEREILPQIIRSSDLIRVWSAGCATGEEAYSIAMLLSEQLSPAQFQERVKVYATDVDEEALMHARQAAYSLKSLESVPTDLRQKYFTPTPSGEVFRTDLRRQIVFGRHDLVQDAPIPKLNLLICRNTLMYLNAETQKRILARLHFALKPDGYLFLGRAEMLLSHAALFEPVDLQHRVFSKVKKANLRDRLGVLEQANGGEDRAELQQYLRLKECSFDQGQVAQIVVDENGTLVLANEKARLLFNINTADVGRSFKDLEISYRPLELRSLIDQCLNDRPMASVHKVPRVMLDGSTQNFEVQVSPLRLNGTEPFAVSITFDDVTKFYRLYDDLRRTHEDLETTNEELESTNEELETTNEELQSTNEELETTNEELQSTNEELETTNAELQSMNEELETTNNELRLLTEEVERTNNFLQTVLGSLNQAVVVLDKENRILIWNPRAEDFWGVRADEAVGSRFLELDIGLPLKTIADNLKNWPQKEQFVEFVVEAINRRGRRFNCSVRMSPLIARANASGVVMLMEDTSA
jgi:two-component system CheB/CheR fusion protein